MSVKTYSRAKEGSKMLSANFKVSEFKCKDGSDKILVDEALVDVLQDIRDHFKKAVNINSAYRTESYNKKVGGASKSQHLYGKAADIVISGVKPREVAVYAESKGVGGIGLYEYGGTSGFCHVDTRSGKSRWIQTSKNGSAKTVSGFGGSSGSTSGLLKEGSRGDEVKELQQQLNALGYSCGSADGIFGSKTEQAVKAFQKDHGLVADGMVGDKTKAALSQPTGDWTVSRLLKKTNPLMSGTDVKNVQKALIAKGYSCGSSGTDGKYGDDTVAAVKKFQKAKGLSVDGQAGKNTVTALGGKWAGSTSTTSWTVSRLLKKTSPLMSGEDVKNVQKALIAKGYSCGSSGADGKYGDDTVAAVKKFQKAKGLSVDGQAGKNTVTALGGKWQG